MVVVMDMSFAMSATRLGDILLEGFGIRKSSRAETF
jgi:hypothetical protein